MAAVPEDLSAVAVLLAQARSRLGYRPGPHELLAITHAGGVLVDTRPAAQRERDGELPGAAVIERNHLEWRLDPTSPSSSGHVTSPDQVVVVVCDEGYSSSLAAATLRDLGLTAATDLDGGFQAWLAAGRPPVTVDAPA
jgi:rhodanese-related sulfurtransferase